jgi:RHS repeat-associated protein
VITETMPGGEPGLAIVVAPDGNRWRFQVTELALPFGTYFHPLPGVPHAFVQHFEFDDTFSTFTTTYQLTTRDQQLWTYDLGGRLIGKQDAQGHALTLTYSPTETTKLIRVADADNANHYLALTYNPDGQISQVSDGSRFVTYAYTDTGDLIRATDVMSRPTDYTYQDHLLTQITNALGQAVEQTSYDQYTPAGRVIEQTLLDGRHYAVDYQPDATEMTITGPDGRQDVQEYRYDASETLTGTSVNDQVQSYSDFEEHFAPGSRSDANGNTTSTVFNAAGQPLTVTNALEQTTQVVYDSQNHPTTITDSLGRQTVSVYDDHNNLVRQTTGITTASPLGFTNFYTYTADQRLLAQSGPDGVVTRQAYDGQGQVISTTVGYGSALAQTTTTGYDQYGRVVTTTTGFGTPLARADVTRYNADDTIAETIANYQDGVFTPSAPDEDIVTTYGYDALGRQAWVRDVLGHYDVTHYDARGRVDWRANNFVQGGWSGGVLPGSPPAYSPATPDRNVATFYGIDGLGRTAFVTETGILTGTFNTTTLQFSDVTSRTTRTEYDTLSRPVTVTLNEQPDLGASADRNVQLLTRYDAAGNVIGQRDALGRWTTTDYDALNRPITVTVNYENGDPLTVDLANQGWTDGSDTDIVSVTHYRPDGSVDQQIDNYVDGVFTATEPITDRITLDEYDALSRVVTTTLNYDPPTLGSRTDTNRSSVTAYDPAIGRVIGQRDALGRWVSQQYDLLGRVTTTMENCTGGSTPASCGTLTADENVPTTTHYDALGRGFERVDALDHVMYTRYDGLGRSVATIQNYIAPGTPTTAITNVTTLAAYDGLGRTTVMTDALGATTRQGYNGLSQTVIVTDSIGRVTRMGYDGTGALRWSKRNDGQVTVMQVDGLGRTIATIVNYDDGMVGGSEPSDQDLISRVVYDKAGRRTRTIDPANRVTALAYDQLDRLITVTENAVTGSCSVAPCNVQTQYQYDRAGNRTAIVDARGNLRTFAYDAANQQTTTDDPVHPPTSWEYDRGGRMTVQHDPRGITNTLSFSYDGLDRRTQTSATNLGTITAAYDALGRRLSLADGTGTTSFAYDPLGRITRVTAPQTGAVGSGYDARGARSSLSYPNSGPTLQYAYWPDGQLRVVTDTTTLASSSYDQLGRLATTTRANGQITSSTYDQADRLRSLTTTVGSTTTSAFAYQVNRLGLRTVVTETLGISALPVVPVVDDLNDFGTMAAHTTNLGLDTSNASFFGGDASRLRRESTSGAWAVWHLEGMDAFTAVSYHWSGEALGDFTFFASPDTSSYTPITPTVTTTAGDWLRVVDDLRLPAGTNYVKVVFPSTSSQFWNPQLSQVAYRRPASAATRVIAYSYDGLQRLTGAAESPGTTFAYAYDLAGNRTGVWVNGTRILTQTYNIADEVVGWTYDHAGNLTDDGTHTYAYDPLNHLVQRDATTYTYDADGVLVGETTGGSTISYTQDLASPLSQILQTINGGTTTDHLYGLERLASESGGTRTWYGSDGLGSVRQTLNASGAVLSSVDYDPWGQVESGTTPGFGFTGEMQDSGGMVYLRAQWYNARQGRFGVRDPFAGMMERPQTLAPYPYVENDPVNRVDPSGKLGIFVMGGYGPRVVVTCRMALGPTLDRSL